MRGRPLRGHVDEALVVASRYFSDNFAGHYPKSSRLPDLDQQEKRKPRKEFEGQFGLRNYRIPVFELFEPSSIVRQREREKREREKRKP